MQQLVYEALFQKGDIVLCVGCRYPLKQPRNRCTGTILRQRMEHAKH